MVTQTLSSIHQQLTQLGAPFELANCKEKDVAMYKQAPDILGKMLGSARKESDATFLVYGEDRWSFTRFYDAVDRVASYLQLSGIEPGHRIAIAMRNRPEWAVFFVATVMIGAVPAPINSFGLGEELNAALEDIQADVFVCDEVRLHRLQTVTDALPTLTICLFDEVYHHPRVVDALAVLDYFNKTWVEPKLKADDPALILFTSGATSRAKAVLSNQRAVCQALYNINYITAISAMSSPKAIEAIMASGLPPVALTAVPLFHVSGLHAQLLNGLLSHRTLVFIHKWDTDAAISLLEQERVTIFNGAPAMIMQMMRHPEFSQGPIANRLAGLGFGGAGIPKKLISEVLDKMSNKMMGIGYGMTESNGVAAAGSGEIFKANPYASGVISPIMQVRVIREDGSVGATGTLGEIQLKGITLMDGYLDPKKGLVSPIDSEGWLNTGDIGYVDEDNYLHVVDRIKDVINRAGENVSAAEVECCLLHHEDVLEVGVTGIPDEDLGEAVVAVVSLRHGSYATEMDLIAYCKAHLSAFKVPSKVIITDEKLPRNPAGKLLKAKLKDNFVGALV